METKLTDTRNHLPEKPGSIFSLNRSTSHQTSEEHIYNTLVESPLFQTYRRAFVNATGMSLVLLPADDEIVPAEQPDRFQNLFCRQLNSGKESCHACELADCRLANSVVERPETITCFAKMRETAIPIRAANKTIALLSTGQIFTEKPKSKEFEVVKQRLAECNGTSEMDVDLLQKSWADGRVVTLDEYEGMITILAVFALQLSELLNRLLIENENSEPDIVIKAKRYINENLEEKVCLDKVSLHVGVSPFYFCKLFKQSTGMTLTEYVNRRRVEWAKRKLLNPQARVTDVAYDIGYQSLSQFNRSFLKYVGVSPTRFREKQSSPQVPTQKVAA